MPRSPAIFRTSGLAKIRDPSTPGCCPLVVDGPSTANGHQPGADSRERIFASPLVRKIAGERGIDLAAIDGTGPNGRIVRRDLE
ncbi:MAG: E3 binding domain-containing protein, partial [Trebonia sp.]